MASLAAAFDILTRGADKAAADLDRVGNSSERTGGKVAKAGGNMRLMASTFTSASNQALGPLQEIANKFDVIAAAQQNASTKAGGRLLGIGAGAIGAGAFLASLHSREQGAAQQLQASIEATGGSYGDFSDQIDKAVKSGEHFGNQASTTLDALNRLTITTHSPTAALKDLQVALDIAALKHIPLSKAAEQVGLLFNGSARAGKSYGVTLTSLSANQAAFTKAQGDAKTANDRVTAAQQSYNDKLAVYQQTLKPTLAQQIALFRSHQALVSAQDNNAAAATRLKDAQQKAAAASTIGQQNVAKVAVTAFGQAAAAADTFNGHLKSLGAKIEDTAGHFGAYGRDISTVGVAITGAAALVESGLFRSFGKVAAKLGITDKAFKTLRDTEVVTSAEGAAAVEAGAARAETAMAAEGAAAGRLSTLLKKVLGFGAVGGIVAAGIGFSIKEAVDTNRLTGSLNDQVKALAQAEKTAEDLTDKAAAIAAAIKRAKQLGVELSPTGEILFINPTAKNRNQQTAGAQILEDAKKAQRDLELAYLQLNDSNSFANKAADNLASKAASAGVLPTAKHGGKRHHLTDAEQRDQWLQEMFGGTANQIMQAAAAEAARIAKQAAVDSATAIRDTIKDQFDTAKQLLDGLIGQATQLRQSIADSLKSGSSILDVFGTGPNLNANHAFGSGQDFASVKRFFEDRLVKLKRFAAELSALVHKGLDPAIVAQIAQAGLDGGGGRLADALSGSTRGQLGELNSLNGQVSQLADSAGKRVADVQFREQIATAKKTNDILAKELKEANLHLRAISREKAPSAVDQRSAAFLAGA